MKIICAVGLGIFSSGGMFFYSVLMSRTRNSVLRFLLFLTWVVLFLFGGLIGCFALGRIFDHNRQIPTAHEDNIAHLILALWAGILALYIFLDGRRAIRRIRTIDSA